ncbi:MAG: hypothetical protein ACI90M_002793 [Candidatus Azotimanducaceae bacterium]|jgi:hypothetical protein
MCEQSDSSLGRENLLPSRPIGDRSHSGLGIAALDGGAVFGPETLAATRYRRRSRSRFRNACSPAETRTVPSSRFLPNTRHV